MMEPEANENATAEASMVSSSSPYQPTTEPVSDRRTICAGFILDMQFVKSLPGILKVVEILLCIIIMICLGSAGCRSAWCSGIPFLRGMAIWSFIFTFLLFACFALMIHTKIEIIHWGLTDLISSAIDCLAFIIASIITAAEGGNAGSTAGAVFGFFVAGAYGASAWIAYRSYIVSRHRNRSNVSHIAGVQE